MFDDADDYKEHDIRELKEKLERALSYTPFGKQRLDEEWAHRDLINDQIYGRDKEGVPVKVKIIKENLIKGEIYLYFKDGINGSWKMDSNSYFRRKFGEESIQYRNKVIKVKWGKHEYEFPSVIEAVFAGWRAMECVKYA